MLAYIKQRLLRLSRDEALFSRRKFPGSSSPSREHLESILQTFIDGYNLALSAQNGPELARRLDESFAPALLGFAYEGAGLFYALTDLLSVGGKSRLREFVQGAARQHEYIVSVGAGFAVARVPLALKRLDAYQEKLDPMSAWCLADGFGFHQGFFHWQRYIGGAEPAPASFDLQQRSLFDAGVGRAMWWVFGAAPERIAASINDFAPERRAEMWTGIGTAYAYAGNGFSDSGAQLAELAGPYAGDFLSGVVLAAHMRHKGGNPADWSERACVSVLGWTVCEASDFLSSEVNAFLNALNPNDKERWRTFYIGVRARLRRGLLVRTNASDAGLPAEAKI